MVLAITFISLGKRLHSKLIIKPKILILIQ